MSKMRKVTKKWTNLNDGKIRRKRHHRRNGCVYNVRIDWISWRITWNVFRIFVFRLCVVLAWQVCLNYHDKMASIRLIMEYQSIPFCACAVNMRRRHGLVSFPVASLLINLKLRSCYLKSNFSAAEDFRPYCYGQNLFKCWSRSWWYLLILCNFFVYLQ